MKTRKLSLSCPTCGSPDVFYSCTPNCCFNHVCNDCQTTFEPATKAAGGSVTGVEAPDPLPDSTEPTVNCCRCDSLEVYVLEDGRLVCRACGRLLELEITEVAEAPA
ncbi:MAG: hypothetical protein WD696_05820 [Bryobacteraceae bacterium]